MNEIINVSHQNIVEEVREYLKLKECILKSNTVEEKLKELCVARLCKSIGIRCEYNYKSEFFEFFSSITAEAICQKLGILMHVASDDIRLIKYEHLNLVEEVKKCLNNEDVDEAFIDAFNFVDNHKHLIEYIKKFR